MRPFAVLYFRNSMILAFVNDCLFPDFGMGDVVDQCPTNAATRTSVNEAVLWTGIQGILSIHKFWMKYDVTLLTLGLQVGQSFPSLQIFRTGNACCWRNAFTFCSNSVIALSY